MTFTTISQLTRDLRARADTFPPLPEGADLRHVAAAIALGVHGRQKLEQLPELVNFAALAVEVGDRPVVHELRRGAVGLVHRADLHALPGEPPRLLRRGWIVETRGDRAPAAGPRGGRGPGARRPRPPGA